MKTKTFPRLLIALVTIALFAVVLKSCKKVDKNAANTNEAAAKEAVQKAIQKEYGNVSAGIIIPVNKAADEYFYRDASGQMTSLYGNLTSRTGINGPSLCKANCNTTSNPADLRIIYTLDYVQRFYECESNGDKSTVTVKWTVSVPFQIGYTIGNVPPLHYGNVRFKNSSGTVINTLTATNGQVASTMIGADPSCPTWNNLWEVTYKFTQVTNGNFASGNTIEASVSLENDCALVGNVVLSGYVSAPAFSQNAYLPCNRIDKMYVYSTIQLPGPNATALGNYQFTCPYPTTDGFVPIDFHQLEYRRVNATNGSLKWDDQINGSPASQNAIYWGVPTSTSTSNPTITGGGGFNLTAMTPGTGKWLVRYRNVKTSTCNTFLNSSGSNSSSPDPQAGAVWGNTALWVTEVVQQ